MIARVCRLFNTRLSLCGASSFIQTLTEVVQFVLQFFHFLLSLQQTFTRRNTIGNLGSKTTISAV